MVLAHHAALMRRSAPHESRSRCARLAAHVVRVCTLLQWSVWPPLHVLCSERMERWPSDVQYRRRELLNRSALVGVVARRAQASKTRGSELFSGSHTTIGLRHGPKQRETSRFRTVTICNEW